MARRFSTRVGKIRRQTQWDALEGWTTTTFSAPGEGFVVAFSEFNTVITAGPVPPPTPLTIIRTLISYAVSQSVAPDRFYGAIGVTVVTQDALEQALLGVKSVPLPVSDAGSDAWLLHSFIMGNTATAGVNDGSGVWGMIESKGQRKIDDGYQLIVVAERDAEVNLVGGSSFVLQLNLRALVKVA